MAIANDIALSQAGIGISPQVAAAVLNGNGARQDAQAQLAEVRKIAASLQGKDLNNIQDNYSANLRGTLADRFSRVSSFLSGTPTTNTGLALLEAKYIANAVAKAENKPLPYEELSQNDLRTIKANTNRDYAIWRVTQPQAQTAATAQNPATPQQGQTTPAATTQQPGTAPATAPKATLKDLDTSFATFASKDSLKPLTMHELISKEVAAKAAANEKTMRDIQAMSSELEGRPFEGLAKHFDGARKVTDQLTQQLQPLYADVRASHQAYIDLVTKVNGERAAFTAQSKEEADKQNNGKYRIDGGKEALTSAQEEKLKLHADIQKRLEAANKQSLDSATEYNAKLQAANVKANEELRKTKDPVKQKQIVQAYEKEKTQLEHQAEKEQARLSAKQESYKEALQQIQDLLDPTGKKFDAMREEYNKGKADLEKRQGESKTTNDAKWSKDLTAALDKYYASCEKLADALGRPARDGKGEIVRDKDTKRVTVASGQGLGEKAMDEIERVGQAQFKAGDRGLLHALRTYDPKDPENINLADRDTLEFMYSPVTAKFNSVFGRIEAELQKRANSLPDPLKKAILEKRGVTPEERKALGKGEKGQDIADLIDMLYLKINTSGMTPERAQNIADIEHTKDLPEYAKEAFRQRRQLSVEERAKLVTEKGGKELAHKFDLAFRADTDGGTMLQYMSQFYFYVNLPQEILKGKNYNKVTQNSMHLNLGSFVQGSRFGPGILDGFLTGKTEKVGKDGKVEQVEFKDSLGKFEAGHSKDSPEKRDFEVLAKLADFTFDQYQLNNREGRKSFGQNLGVFFGSRNLLNIAQNFALSYVTGFGLQAIGVGRLFGGGGRTERVVINNPGSGGNPGGGGGGGRPF